MVIQESSCDVLKIQIVIMLIILNLRRIILLKKLEVGGDDYTILLKIIINSINFKLNKRKRDK